MAMNLIQLAKSQLTPEIIQRASALVGESPGSTQKAMDLAAPTLIAGLAETAASPAGADRLLHVLDEAGLSGLAGSYLENLKGGEAGAQSLMQTGKELLGRVLGSRTSSLVDATASSTGMKRSSMHALLGLVTPLLLGGLGREVHARHLDAAGLAGLLEEQKRAAVDAVPVTGAAPRAPEMRPIREVERVPAEGMRRTWPLLLLLPLLVIGALLLRRRDTPAPAEPRTTVESTPAVREAPIEPRRQVDVTLPGGGVQHFSEGAIGYQLSQFLASPSETTPKRFVFDQLNFDTATTQLTPGSTATVGGVAAVLKAYPSAQIQLEGHTDNTGDASSNQALSTNRAEAVKRALVAQGIAPDRIAVSGVGQEHPIASNDNEEGRARNRRTELVVVRR